MKRALLRIMEKDNEMEEKKTVLALFDFDGTMISGDSIVSFLKFALKRKDLSLPGYLKGCFFGVLYVLKIIGSCRAKSASMKFYHALPAEKRQALDKTFAAQLLKGVYPGARETLAVHKREGRHTVLVSASTENYMRHVADGLGFDGLLCTPLEKDGSILHNCHGAEKVKRIEKYLEERHLRPDFSLSFAYGDSRGDLPMLRLCGHPVIANGKRALLKAAPDLPRENWKK